MGYRLYGYWRSSSAWRVRIGLALKGIAYEYVAIDLQAGDQDRPDHVARSPLHQVPVLEVARQGPPLRLVQSMAILEWLEERHREPPLLPPDADGRARVRALAEHVNSGIQPYQNHTVLEWLRERQAGLEQTWVRHWVAFGLNGLERAVQGGAGRFCHGDQVTLADLYLVPQLYGARRFGVDLAACPTLLRVEASCRELEAFRRAEPEAQPDAAPPDRRS